MKFTSKTFIGLLLASTLIASAENPIIHGIGLTDPHIVIYGERAYLYGTHDFSPDTAGFLTKDWWVWSSADLVHWRHDGTLRPEETFLRRPFDQCWATFGVSRGGNYYWYFSAGPTEIGVVEADSPTGPWKDPLGKPLIARGSIPTEARDPDVFVDDDGEAYIIFGVWDYYLARLNTNMISLAEKPRLVVLDQKFGPYGAGKTDDKPSLHKRNGVYYLSWSSFYAMATNVYGPYTYKGSVITTTGLAPEFRRGNIFHDRHGNFFTWHHQWYYACNDKSQPPCGEFFRDTCLSYVHYRDNGEMAPIRIDCLGVGQYDATQPCIEAEDFFALEGGDVRENPDGGFEVRNLHAGSYLIYPNIRNLHPPAQITLRVACPNPAGMSVEIRSDNARGKLLGQGKIPFTGNASHYENVTCPIDLQSTNISLCFSFSGNAGEFLRLDWFSLNPSVK